MFAHVGENLGPHIFGGTQYLGHKLLAGITCRSSAIGCATILDRRSRLPGNDLGICGWHLNAATAAIDDIEQVNAGEHLQAEIDHGQNDDAAKTNGAEQQGQQHANARRCHRQGWSRRQKVNPFLRLNRGRLRRWSFHVGCRDAFYLPCSRRVGVCTTELQATKSKEIVGPTLNYCALER